MAKRRDRLIVLIGAFKLLKAALLITVGIGAITEHPGQLAQAARRAAHWLNIAPGHQWVHRGMQALATVDPQRMRHLGLVALIYAAVFLVEGAGLVLRKRWAEWLTVAVTGSFIPLEIYELVHRPGVGKVVALFLNVAIVGYLTWRRLEDRGRAGQTFRRRPHLRLVEPAWRSPVPLRAHPLRRARP